MIAVVDLPFLDDGVGGGLDEARYGDWHGLVWGWCRDTGAQRTVVCLQLEWLFSVKKSEKSEGRGVVN